MNISILVAKPGPDTAEYRSNLREVVCTPTKEPKRASTRVNAHATIWAISGKCKNVSNKRIKNANV